MMDCIHNDYLGMGRNPQVRDAAIRAIKRYGMSAAGCRRSMNGDIYSELENNISSYVKSEGAIVYPTGCTAVYFGLLYFARAYRIKTILIDKYAYYPARVAARAYAAESGTEAVYYKHKNISIKLFDNAKKPYAVFTDSISLIDGKCIDLKRIHDICIWKDAALIVDDSHGVGLVGPYGCGCLSSFMDLTAEDVSMLIGSFSKTIGCHGGYIASYRDILDKLLHMNAIGTCHTTAPSPGIAAAANRSISILRGVHGCRLRTKIGHKMEYFNKISGVKLEVPAMRFKMRSIKHAEEVYHNLKMCGIETGIMYPAERGEPCRIEICLTVNHTKSQLEMLIGTMRNFGL